MTQDEILIGLERIYGANYPPQKQDHNERFQKIADWIEEKFIEREKMRKIMGSLLRKIADNLPDTLEVEDE